MRNLLIISLIGLHLLGNTELGQIMKLPRLFKHFEKHQQNDPSLSFFKFLLMHYAGDDGTTADDSDDMQLPCHDYQHTGIFFVFAPVSNMEPGPVNMFCSDEVIYGGRLTAYNPSEHIFSFLRPPRKVWC